MGGCDTPDSPFCPAQIGFAGARLINGIVSFCFIIAQSARFPSGDVLSVVQPVEQIGGRPRAAARYGVPVDESGAAAPGFCRTRSCFLRGRMAAVGFLLRMLGFQLFGSIDRATAYRAVARVGLANRPESAALPRRAPIRRRRTYTPQDNPITARGVALVWLGFPAADRQCEVFDMQSMSPRIRPAAASMCASPTCRTTNGHRARQ